MRNIPRKLGASVVALLYGLWSMVAAHGYAFNEIVPDVRQSSNISGGSACPLRVHQLTSPGSIAFRWSTAPGSNPVTIITQDQTPTGRLNEIEQTIQQSLSVWTGVPGTTLTPASLVTLVRVASPNTCSS
jgi:hypothetical protein